MNRIVLFIFVLLMAFYLKSDSGGAFYFAIKDKNSDEFIFIGNECRLKNDKRTPTVKKVLNAMFENHEETVEDPLKLVNIEMNSDKLAPKMKMTNTRLASPFFSTGGYKIDKKIIGHKIKVVNKKNADDSIVLDSQAFTNRDVESALYLKAFGKHVEIQTLNIPLYFGKARLGELSTKLDSNGNIIHMDKNSLLILLTPILEDAAIDSIRTLPSLIRPSDLSFKITYHSDKMNINIDLPVEIIKRTVLGRIGKKLESGQSPSPLSLIINTTTSAESNSSSMRKFFTVDSDSYLNIHSQVLYNKTRHFHSNIGETINKRELTNLSGDIQLLNINYVLGDTLNKNMGYLNSSNILGVSLTSGYFFKNLDQDLNDREYLVLEDSTVRYYINDVLIKSFESTRGKYVVEDFNLSPGENIIRIEVTNGFGVKTQYVFEDYLHQSLLRKNQGRYSLSLGERTLNTSSKLLYDSKDVIGTLTMERGLTNTFTANVYKQTSPNYNIDGVGGVLASGIGMIDLNIASSKSSLSGSGVSSKFGISNDFKLGHYPLRANFSRELIGSNFSRNNSVSLNPYATIDALSLSTSLNDRISANLRLEQLRYRNSPNLKKDYIETIGLNYRPSNNISTFINLSEKQRQNQTDQAISIGLNLSFDGARISTQYKSISNELRESYDQNIKYNNNANSTLSVNHRNSHKDGEQNSDDSINASFNYNGRYSNLSVGGTVSRSYKNDNSDKNGRVNKIAKIRSSSSIISAYDNGNFGFSIAPTVSDSAAIVVLNKGGDGQVIKLLGRKDVMAKQGLFGELVDTNIGSRRLQSVSIDPSELDSNYVIENETARLSPSPHSVSLISVGRLGGFSLKGYIHDKNSKPIANMAGKLHASDNTTIDFFTNDNGLFYAEAIPHGEIELTLDRGAIKLPSITIKEDQKGLVDLGILTAP